MSLSTDELQQGWILKKLLEKKFGSDSIAEQDGGAAGFRLEVSGVLWSSLLLAVQSVISDVYSTIVNSGL